MDVESTVEHVAGRREPESTPQPPGGLPLPAEEDTDPFYLTAAGGSKHLQGTTKKEKAPREGRIPDALRKAKDLTEDYVDRLGIPTIFTLSTFPNPLTTFATITAGSMGMGFRSFLVANFAGHVILGLILALFGEWLLGV